jgi:hypothetical protein
MSKFKLQYVFYVAVLLSCFLSAVNLVCADSVSSYGTANYYFASGESFIVQNNDLNTTLTFLVQNGTFNSTGTLFYDNSTGSLSVYPFTNGNLTITALGTVTVYVNGVLYSGIQPFYANKNLAVTWVYAYVLAAPAVFSEDDLVSFAVIAILVVFVVVACLFLVQRRKNN